MVNKKTFQRDFKEADNDPYKKHKYNDITMHL